jgi:hypothetical protein
MRRAVMAGGPPEGAGRVRTSKWLPRTKTISPLIPANPSEWSDERGEKTFVGNAEAG